MQTPFSKVQLKQSSLIMFSTRSLFQATCSVLVDYFLKENLYLQHIGIALELNLLNDITKEYPPTVIIHGPRNRFVPYNVSVQAASCFEELGVKVKLITVLEADYTFDHFARATDNTTSKIQSTYLSSIFRYLDEFTSKNSKTKQSPIDGIPAQSS